MRTTVIRKHTADLKSVVGRWSTETTARSIDGLGRILAHSGELGDDLVEGVVSGVKDSYRSIGGSGRRVRSHGAIWVNALLASDFGVSIEHWLGSTFNEGIPSAYDRAIDAVYNTTHIGGGALHRLLDGSHSLGSMWGKAQGALPEDSLSDEIVGYVSALGKDLSSTVGIPIADFSRSSYEQLATTLHSSLGLPRSWIADCLHINATELFGGSIAAIAVALNWSERDSRKFLELTGSTGVAAAMTANPLLGIVSIVALARAFTVSQGRTSAKFVVKGVAQGGVMTGIFIGTAGLVGGPTWIGLLTGLCLVSALSRVRTLDRAEVAGFVRRALSELRRRMQRFESGQC